MQTIRPAKEEDGKQWDAYVQSHPDSSAYHLWAWKQTVEQAYGHKTHYLLAEKAGEICGVFPFINITIPFFLNEFTALPFCDVGNCLADSAQIQAELLEEGIVLAEKKQSRKVSIRGKSLESGNNYRLTVEETGKVRMILPLPGSSEILLKGFKSKLRSQIRKAEKNGVQFRWANVDGVDPFYDVYSMNMHNLGSPPHSRKWFHEIMSNYGDNAKIGLTEYEGKCIGGGLILSTKKQTSIPWASTLREFNRLSPNMLLYWNFLQFSADTGRKTFDFGRSTEGEGTYRFKKQWGANAERLFWYSLRSEVKQEQKKSTSNARSKVAAVWAKLPLAMANVIGPYLVPERKV